MQSLPPRVFDCIAYLAGNRERAVGRDELIAAVWGRTEVSDNLLDQIMLRARRALGDIEGERRVIRTVLRFGYAWVAPTEVMGLDEETLPAASASLEPHETGATRSSSGADGSALSAPSATDSSRRPRGWAVSALLLVLIGVLVWQAGALRKRDIATAPRPGANLALLLPVTIHADAKFAWARLGAMDLIAERLRAAGQPMLPSDNVVALARDLRGPSPEPTELRDIVQTSAANLVMKATATLSAGYWRVSVESLHGRDPPLLAEGESRDLLEAAQAAADRVAHQLGLTPPVDGDLLSPRERALDGLLQKVEAAMLADQPDSARALLESLDAEQRALPEVRYRRANVEFSSGHIDIAQAQFQELLDSTSADDPLFRARVLNGLGNVASRRDDYAAAARAAGASIALLADAAPSLELGRALTGRAIAQSAQSRFEPAVADFAKARVVLESVGDRLGLARVDANLGILDARRDRYAEALPLLEGAAGRLATFHDLTSELFARVAAAYAHLAMLDPATALVMEPRLRELAEREPNPQWRRYVALARAEVFAANGRLAQARDLLQAVLDDAGKANDTALRASAEIVAARQALAAGEPRRAAALAGRVLQTSWAAESSREHASAWSTLLRAQLALADTAAAAATAAAIQTWAERDDSAPARLHAALASAEYAAATGRSAPATMAFDQALSLAESGRVPEDVLMVCDAYATWLIGRGDLARAGTIAARVATWSERSFKAAVLQVRLYHALNQVQPWRNALALARRLAGERVVPAELDELAPMPP